MERKRMSTDEAKASGLDIETTETCLGMITEDWSNCNISARQLADGCVRYIVDIYHGSASIHLKLCYNQKDLLCLLQNL